ncbi:hypothetical protein HDA32_002809 [Spinactinospora alkalitolerans]|uniref:Uncharacterized protein n=1 Tax=Spinactinospora alkalitolerans TaxID=687207 RepID=A0A852TUH8_9ACTN|nr:hypothetical protein [Spinactinospora alkalitolerans]NYE47689.1 hypothetical protein [Spinactinospora alkalitolerans]
MIDAGLITGVLAIAFAGIGVVLAGGAVVVIRERLRNDRGPRGSAAAAAPAEDARTATAQTSRDGQPVLHRP